MKKILSLLLCLFLLLPLAGQTDAKAAEASPFTDVPAGAYYHDAVLWAVKDHITLGTSPATFSPFDICTRGQVVTFLWRALGCPASHVQEPFADVPGGAYYCDAVLWAVETGVTTGTSANTFSPDAPCSDGQILTLLWRTKGSPAVGEAQSREPYYAGAVRWAEEMELLSGMEGTFDPEADSPRAHIVTYLYRASLLQQAASIWTEGSVPLNSTDSMGYLLYQPSSDTKGLPLLVYLHGGSGKGSDLSLLTVNDGFPKYLKDGTLGTVAACVLIPQLPVGLTGWSEVGESLTGLIQSICGEYGLDTDRVSLTGHSMGGTGVWALAVRYPHLFSCAAPLSGSVRSTPDILNVLRALPIRSFVGAEDTIVDPESAKSFVAQLQQRGYPAEITVLPGADHFAVPSLVYLDPELGLIQWLLSTHRPILEKY